MKGLTQTTHVPQENDISDLPTQPYITGDEDTVPSTTINVTDISDLPTQPYVIGDDETAPSVTNDVGDSTQTVAVQTHWTAKPRVSKIC